MATHLDLEEQEQLDQLKAFWKQYGNLITWVLIAGAGRALPAWNGWNWWQRDQAVKAGAMFDELERAAQAGDVAKAGRHLRRHEGALPAHRLRAAGRAAGGQGAVREGPGRCGRGHAGLGGRQRRRRRVPDGRAPAPGRRAARPEEVRRGARSSSTAPTAKEFEALVADRRGDVLLAQGKTDEAKAAYSEGLEGHGRQGRLPPPDRRQADRAGRRAAGRSAARPPEPRK